MLTLIKNTLIFPGLTVFIFLRAYMSLSKSDLFMKIGDVPVYSTLLCIVGDWTDGVGWICWFGRIQLTGRNGRPGQMVDRVK